MTRTSENWGGPLAIDVSALVAVALALWIPSVPDVDSAPYLASNITSVRGAMIAASVLVVAMLLLFAYALWLRGAFTGNGSIRAGAGILAAGAVTHLVVNALILVFLAGDMASHQGLWDFIKVLSHGAFGLLGLATLVVGRGLDGPDLLRVGGITTGVLGVLTAGGVLLRPLDLLVLPFTVLFLIWLVGLGYRPRPRRRTGAPDAP